MSRNRLGLIASLTGVLLAFASGSAPRALGAIRPCFAGNCVIVSTPDGSRVLFGTGERLSSLDTDSGYDVYLRTDGKTTLFSTDSSGRNTPEDVFVRAASPDLDQVIFSTADGLVGDDQDGEEDLYQRSAAGTVPLTSPEPSSCSPGFTGYCAPQFVGASADATHVFDYTPERLASADTDNEPDIYDLHAGAATLVSGGTLDGGPDSGSPEFGGVSADGSTVYFTTPERLEPGDTDAGEDAYRRKGGTTDLVTPDVNPGGNSGSMRVQGVAADGNRVYVSTEAILDPAFPHPRGSGLYRIEGGGAALMPWGPSEPAGTGGSFVAETGDGSRAFFFTRVDLVPGDVDGQEDLYEYSGGTAKLLSTGPRGSGDPDSPDRELSFDALAPDGAVFFTTFQQLVGVDADNARDIYRRDSSGVRLISVGGGRVRGDPWFAGLAAGGSRVFYYDDLKLVPEDPDAAGDFNADLYMREGGTTTLVSKGPAHQPAISNNSFVDLFATSADGNHVFFGFGRLTADDSDVKPDLYERRLGAGEATLVSAGETRITTGPVGRTTRRRASFAFSTTPAGADFECSLDQPRFATCRSPRRYRGLALGKHTFRVRAVRGGKPEPNPAEREFVVVEPPEPPSPPRPGESAYFWGAAAEGSSSYFITALRLDRVDRDGSADIYRRAGRSTSLVSTGPAGGNDGSRVTLRAISAGGSRGVFETAERLTSDDPDQTADVFLREKGRTTLLSTGPDDAGIADAHFAAASADATLVFFATRESLVPGDGDDFTDIYERRGSTTTLVSTGSGGSGGGDASLWGATPSGDTALFLTRESFDPADTDGRKDLYRRRNGVTTLISTGPAGGNGNFDPVYAGSSDSGDRVIFETAEPLIAADTDANTDVYERVAGTTNLLSAAAGAGNGPHDATVVPGPPQSPTGLPQLRPASVVSPDGTRVVIETTENLTPQDTDNGFADLFAAQAGALEMLTTGPLEDDLALPVHFGGATPDASRVFFSTDEQLVAADHDVFFDIYASSASGTELATRESTVKGRTGSLDFAGAASDGSPVFITTRAGLLHADRDGSQDDIYRIDGNRIRLVSGSPLRASGRSGGGLAFGSNSEDGSRVYFTAEGRLLRSDRDRRKDVYEAIGSRLLLISRRDG